MTAKRQPPEGMLPCVWMLAGILSYRLCDRGYDCERCPLDAALQGSASPASSRARASRWEFPGDRLYHPRHGWVQPLADSRARVGLDVLAARLLDRLSAAVLPAVGARLEPGGTIGWFADEGELIPVRAAVPGVVERVNRRAQSDPALIAGSPYGEGWLLELRCDANPASIPHLLPAGQAERRAALQLARLCREAKLSTEASELVGATLADGGEPTGRLRQAGGPERYHRWIVALLS